MGMSGVRSTLISERLASQPVYGQALQNVSESDGQKAPRSAPGRGWRPAEPPQPSGAAERLGHKLLNGR
jgi:hypothetical protein